MKLDFGTWKCGEIRVVRQGVMSSQADLARFVQDLSINAKHLGAHFTKFLPNTIVVLLPEIPDFARKSPLDLGSTVTQVRLLNKKYDVVWCVDWEGIVIGLASVAVRRYNIHATAQELVAYDPQVSTRNIR